MSTTTEAIFPPEFADLEPFAEWSIPTDHERYQKRLASTMPELEAFYSATAPRIPEALAYLDQLDIDDLPEPAIRLLWLFFATATVSFAVDIFKQPRIPDSGSAYIKFVREPHL
jgi:hypothetical protein